MSSFLTSAFTEENIFQTTEQFLKWFELRKASNCFSVERIPFASLDKWNFEKDSKNIVHASGKFFRIEGLSVKTNFGSSSEWQQPILNQPEIGILGILTKIFNGTRYFLMQAKMEPGNLGTLQLSPTVQATRSNYTQVHAGTKPRYLEYFTDRGLAKVLVDQLQSEHGTKFLKKRNRNMIVEVSQDVPVFEDYCWLTLGQIKKLTEVSNFVNMNSKSVIASAPFLVEKLSEEQLRSFSDATQDDYAASLLHSMQERSFCLNSIENIVSWLSEQKSRFEILTKYVELKSLKDWEIGLDEISRISSPLFSVIAVKVLAENREVTQWTQPIIKPSRVGMIGVLTKKINGVLHFLIQALPEPGSIDVVELAPTVSVYETEGLPFVDLFLNPPKNSIRHSSVQSIEGGRFFHYQNRYIVLELDESKSLNVPENYCWLTLHQLLDFLRFTSQVHIELRELIACLNLFATQKVG